MGILELNDRGLRCIDHPSPVAVGAHEEHACVGDGHHRAHLRAGHFANKALNDDIVQRVIIINILCFTGTGILGKVSLSFSDFGKASLLSSALL